MPLRNAQRHLAQRTVLVEPGVLTVVVVVGVTVPGVLTTAAAALPLLPTI